MGDEFLNSPRTWSRRRRLAAVAALATIGLIAGVYWPRPQVQTAPKELAMGWRPILSQAGRGSAQTESFQIDTGQWRIKWTATAEGGPVSPGDALRIAVHSAVSGRMMSVAVEEQGAGSGVAYVAEEPRPFFLSIESSGLEWTVQVEEGWWGEREKKTLDPTQR